MIEARLKKAKVAMHTVMELENEEAIESQGSAGDFSAIHFSAEMFPVRMRVYLVTCFLCIGANWYDTRVADSASVPGFVSAVPNKAITLRHTALVRFTHWITVMSFLVLLVSGWEIIISHPRFYWGDTGNVLTPSLFDLPIPASRSAVQTGYGFVLPDQNGWSRDLHFQSAWIVVFTGLLYIVCGLFTGHFRKHLLPRSSDLRWGALSKVIANHLRFRRPSEEDAWSYNSLQRLTYLFVIFVLFPLMIWTGLAMSPAIVAAFPVFVTVLGGHQSARTIHFFASVLLVAFLVVHIVMVYRAGFMNRTGAMLSGRAAASKDRL